MISFGAQALVCRQIGAAPVQWARANSTVKNLVIDSAQQLAAKRASLNPYSDHLDFLVPLMEHFLAKIEATAAAKNLKQVSDYHDSSIKGIVSEARDRIQNRKMTYEYMITLPFRAGYFLETSRPRFDDKGTPWSPDAIKSLDEGQHFATFFEFQKEFMSSMVDSWSFRGQMARLLRNFKTQTALPMFFTPGFALRNQLFSMGIYPLSANAKWFKSWIDNGTVYTERTGPVHDLGHAGFHILFLNQFSERFTFTKWIENKILLSIGQVHGRRGEGLQFFHHQIFPEDFFISNFERAKSWVEFRNDITTAVSVIEKVGQTSTLPELFRDLGWGAPTTKNIEELEQARAHYLKILEDTLDANAPTDEALQRWFATTIR